MIDTNDPAWLAAEKYHDQSERLERFRQDIISKFPGNEYLLDGDEVPKPPVNRGVKDNKGRPRVNRSILAGWVRYLVAIYSTAEVATKGGDALPSNRYTLGKLEGLGLKYAILSGANPDTRPFSNQRTIGRYNIFAGSHELDLEDYRNAVRGLEVSLSLYLQSIPMSVLEYGKIVGGTEEEESVWFQWKFNRLLHQRLFKGEPWKHQFKVNQDTAVSGPGMSLQCENMKKPTWEYLKRGFELWDAFKADQIKRNPPSTKAIKAFREIRRANPSPNYRKMYEEELGRGNS